MSDLNKLAAAFSSPLASLRLRFGKISSIQNDHTVTVTIGGSTDTVAGVKYLASSAPVPGAVCILTTDGTDIFVLDHIAATGRTLSPRTYRSTDQSIPNDADTAISFDTVSSDLWTCWAAGSPTLLSAPITGRYMAIASLQFAANATNYRSAWVELTGATVLAKTTILAASGAVPTALQVTTPPFTMTKGTDYLRLLVRQNSGGALNCANSSTFAPSLSLVYLGP